MSVCGFHLFLAYNDFHISCILSISVVIVFFSSGVSILRLTVRRSGLTFCFFATDAKGVVAYELELV